MNDPKLKQQIVEAVKGATNILVTVSGNPSVDELSAALGITLLLNKMEKHATAIYSGVTPPAITFLDPEKTFEDSTDSLRDFIVALDKEKAEHLRYKVDGDMVKIFITPYKTTITSDDLEFSQGDYNVDLVVALGVADRDSLDKALNGHGRILHDATVVTVSAGEQTSRLGSIDWRDENASSLSEMLVTLSDALKATLDTPIATAFLTGIVSATERFSNTKTTSRVMTIAAQLMAAGADQQLISVKLEATKNDENISDDDQSADEQPNARGEVSLSEGKTAKLDKSDAEAQPEPKKDDAGTLSISHEKEGELDEVAAQTEKERLEEAEQVATQALKEQTRVSGAASAESTDVLPVVTPAPEPLPPSEPLAEPEAKQEALAQPLVSEQIAPHAPPMTAIEPSPFTAPINSTNSGAKVPPPVDIFAQAPETPVSSTGDVPSAVNDHVIEPVSADFAGMQAAAKPPVTEIRAAVDAALAEQPIQQPYSEPQPAQQPVAPALPPIPEGLPLPPPLPDFSAMTQPVVPQPVTQPAPAGDLPPEQLADIFASDPSSVTSPQAVSNDPGQFKIPGQ